MWWLRGGIFSSPRSLRIFSSAAAWLRPSCGRQPNTRSMIESAKAFKTQADFRRWLRKNHASKTELKLRLYKVHALHKGIGYKQALEEALCWGWIDGVVRSLDADSFEQRYSPRKT